MLSVKSQFVAMLLAAAMLPGCIIDFPTMLDGGADTDADSDTDTDADSDTDTDADSDTDSGSDSASDTGSDTDTGPDTGSDTGSESSTDSDTGSEADTCEESVWAGSYTINSPDDATAFAGTTTITGSLDIYSSELTDLSDLACLHTVGGHFRVYNDPTLQTLDGLQNLTSVGNYFRISANDQLTTIIHLESLDSIGTADPFSIYNNPLLPTCEAEALRDHLIVQGWEGSATIYGNDDTATCEE